MEKFMNRSFATILAFALLALSTSVGARDDNSSAVKLSDAELDQISAGQGAISEVVLFNPGKANVLKITGNHVTCINCLPYDGPRPAGIVNVLTPNGKVVTNIIVQSPFPSSF
jgi:hypothetical protein